MPDHNIDEILEAMWIQSEEDNEDGSRRLSYLLQEEEGTETLKKMEEDGLISAPGEVISLTSRGRERARDIIRRHRLAERLFRDVLDLEDQETHESACRFEHIISEEAADNVCALLGHPSHCPHGKPIPPGNCCEKGAKPVRPLVTTLNRMDMGETAEVAYISAKEGSGFGRRRFGYRGGRGSGISGREETRLSHLASLGIVPGSKIQLVQRRPSYVVKIDETYLGIDDAIAKAIYVKRLDRSRSRVRGAPQGESYP